MIKRGLLLVMLVLLMPIGFAEISVVDVSEELPPPDLPDQQEGTTYYAVMGGQVVASVKDTEVNYHHKDRMGSNVITSDEGVESQSLALPFGRELEQPDHRFTFTGKERDAASQLYYFGAMGIYFNAGFVTSVAFMGSFADLACASQAFVSLHSRHRIQF